MGCAPPQEERLNLLLVTIDTLRRDHLGCYGGDLETPAIDALARASYRFDSAYAVSPTTLPSHASLLTGTYPARHRVRFNGRMQLPPEAVTLAEVLRGAGYRTAAFVGSAVLDAHYGLDQGFETYDDELDPGLGTVQVQRRAEQVSDAVIGYLQQVEEPFFVWAHYFDPHGPYEPPPPWDRRYYEGDPRDEAKDSMAGIPLVFYQNLEGIRDREWPLAQYRGEVSYTDQAVGRLLAVLEAEGLAGETLVVFTADHGESLGENDYWFDHGETLHDAVLGVPLLLKDPRRPLGGDVRGSASLVDLVPTLARLMDVPPPENLGGLDLVPFLEPGELPERTLFLETFLPQLSGHPPRVGAVSGKWKLMAMPGRESLVSPAEDASETRSFLAENPEMAHRLGRELSRYMATEGLREIHLAPDAEEQEKLRALGYLR